MKIKLLLINSSFIILLSQDSFSQNPLVKQWDKRFGGNSNDELYSIQQTGDKGYILGGATYSDIGGDKTQNHFGTSLTSDYWIVKTDSAGIKQWDKDFGGTDMDFLYSVQQTKDGGYIMGGFSQSGISGNKTESFYGFADYWVVKINSLGIKQWEKDLGGTNADQLLALQQTLDGGYILGGWSSSDSSGNKTQHSQGGQDFWVVKLDSLGIYKWDKDFGGTSDDLLYSIQQTSDGGYILGGYSNSGVSGNKTQPNWDSISPISFDYWIVKIDSLGTYEWDRDLGGKSNDLLYSLQQTDDGGYILGGWSSSQISGDKSQPTWGGGSDQDYWIVKTDFTGAKQWDKDFGGTANEGIFGNISRTADGGYLIAGSSYSNISGDKTENNFGVEQTWVVKTNSLGVKQWDKTLHTNCTLPDDYGYAIQTEDGCYAIANFTNGGVAGDKSQPNYGSSYDYWIIKFCDTTLTSLTPALSFGEGVAIAPNPFTNEISIILEKHNLNHVTLTIKNILGETIFSKQLQTSNNTFQTKLDFGYLSKGIYLLEVVTDNEKVVKKIVKE